MNLPIRRVTVHRDAALVVRSGTVKPDGGVACIRGLPLLLDEQSLRTTVTGATVLGVRIQLDLEGLDRADSAEAVQALAKAQANLQILDAELGALQSERSWLASAAPRLDDEDTLPSPEQLVRWSQLDAHFEPWARSLDEQIRALTDKRVDAVEQVEARRHDVHGLSSDRWWRRWAPTRIAVLTLSDPVSEVEVALSYRIRGATWTPSYSLEADATLQRGRFTMRALVVQATGEDWDGVHLSLSTAPADRRVDLPDLPALRIGARQPPTRSAWRPLPTDLDSLFPDDLYPAPPEHSPDDFVALDEPEAEQDLQAFAKPAPAPQPVAMMPMRSESKSRGAVAVLGGIASGLSRSAPPRKRAVAPPRLTPKSQDYPHFRLADYTRPPGERGRLFPVSREALVAESGLPPAAARHLAGVIADLTHASQSATDKPLPPHHTLPGPVEGTDFRFDTNATADVPSDGRFHAVAVFSEPVTLEARYRTVPHADPRVFRIVDARIERSMPLLGGPVSVFVAGDLILTAPWDGTPGRGEISLGLGVEDALQVARNVRYDEQATGLFGGGRQLNTSIEVTVASALAREVRLEILSRVPVADTDDVKIDVLSSEPHASTWEGDPEGPILRGGQRQLIQVPPGGEVVTTVAYAIKIGAKDEIVGGDRRG